MLDNPRFNAALSISAENKWQNPDYRQYLLDQQYQTQHALTELGVNASDPPSKIAKADTILMVPERFVDIRIPYAVEVLGMPGSGKSTMINRYLEELWLRKQRHEVGLANEGVRSLKEEFGDLRYTNPFLYSLMGGAVSYINYMNVIKDQYNFGLRMIVSDRGQIDRRVFRRVYFNQGQVDPQLMAAEKEFMDWQENTPVQVCGAVMFMVKPETSINRIGKEGPVVNMTFLPQMYEQLLRLHHEALSAQIPYRYYELIDAEKSPDEVYEQFKHIMDSSLNIVEVSLGALAKVYPEEVDAAKAVFDKNPGPHKTPTERLLSRKLGLNVGIAGGDEMTSDEEVLENPILEGIRLRKK